MCIYIAKGQMISKGLFGILEFSQKTNEWIRRSSKNEFVRLFFGRIRGYQKPFRNYLTFMCTHYAYNYYVELEKSYILLYSAKSHVIILPIGKTKFVADVSYPNAHNAQ